MTASRKDSTDLERLVRDRTRELGKMNEALRTSEERYRTLFETAPDAIVVHRDGRFLDANKEALRLIGAGSFEELASHVVLDLFRPEDREQAAERMRLAEVESRLPTREATLLRLDGRELVVEFHTARSDFQGVPAVQTIIRDITERKRVEEALREAHNRAVWLARFPEQSPNPVLRATADGSVLYCNPVSATLHGWKCEVGQVLQDELFSLVGRAIAEGEEIQADIELDGRFYLIWVVPFPQEGYVNIYGRDITKRKKAEEALRENQALLSAIMETTPDPVYVKDNQSRIVMANPALAKIVGKPLGEIIGRADSEYYGDPATGHTLREHDLRVMESGQSEVTEETVPTRNGYRTFLSTKTPYRNASGDIIGITGISRDITERKRMEEELRKSRDELEERIEERTVELRKASLYSRSLIEASLDPLVTISADGKITDVNRATELVTGIARGQLIGSDFSDYFTEPEKAREVYKQVFSEESVTDYPLAIRHNSGRVTEVLYNATVYKSEAGEVQGVFATARDITERKRIEDALRESEKRLRFLSSQLLLTQEEERKRLAGEVHDSFSSSLSAVKHRIESMRGQNSPTSGNLEDLKSQIQALIDESKRLQMALRPSILDDLGIISALGWFTREFQKTYSHMAVTNKIDLEEQEIPQQIKTSIFRICQEAFNNAAKHSQAKTLKLSLGKKWTSLRLDIQDDGVGIGSQSLETKGERGRGLGLLSMEERASLSGGVFTIHSEPGKGTTIRVSWPLFSIPPSGPTPPSRTVP